MSVAYTKFGGICASTGLGVLFQLLEFDYTNVENTYNNQS